MIGDWSKKYENLELKDLSNETLVELYEYAVQREHYDPTESVSLPYSADAYKKELLLRLQNYRH